MDCGVKLVIDGKPMNPPSHSVSYCVAAFAMTPRHVSYRDVRLSRIHIYLIREKLE